MALGGIIASRGISFLLTADTRAFQRDMRNAEGEVEGLDEQVNRAVGSTAGLITQMLILGGVAVKAATDSFRAFSKFNAEIALASIAAGQGTRGIVGLSQETLELSKILKQMPMDVAETTRAISFFGGEARKNSAVLTEYSTKLAELSDVSSEQAAERIIRLLRAVGGEEAVTPERIKALSGAIFQVGTNITSSITGLLKFLEISQTLGAVSSLNEVQIVALSGAIADLNERQREIATTAMTRVFLTENFEELSSALGISVDEVKRFRKEDPVGFFLEVTKALKDAERADKFVTLMKDLNIGELRSGRGLSSIIANLDRLEGEGGILSLVSDDVGNVNDLNAAFADRMAESDKRIQEMRASLNQLAITIGGTVAPIFTVLANAVTKFANAIQPIAPLLTILAGVGVGFGMRSLGKRLLSKDGSPVQKALAGLGIGVAGGGKLGELLSGGKTKIGNRVAGGGKFGKLLGLFFAPIMGEVLKDAPKSIQAKHPFNPLKQRTQGVVGAGATKLLRGFNIAGLVSLAADLLQPVFLKLGNTFEDLAELGGMLTGVFRTLANSMKVLELVANLVRAAWTVIVDLFQILGKGLVKVFDALGLDNLSSGLDNAMKSFGDNIDKANSKLRDFNDRGGFVGRTGTGGLSGQADRSSSAPVINASSDGLETVSRELFLSGAFG